MERFMEQVIFKYLRAEPEDHYFLMVSRCRGRPVSVDPEVRGLCPQILVLSSQLKRRVWMNWGAFLDNRRLHKKTVNLGKSKRAHCPPKQGARSRGSPSGWSQPQKRGPPAVPPRPRLVPLWPVSLRRLAVLVLSE